MEAISPYPVIVLISADAEWRAARRLLPGRIPFVSPFGEYFQAEIAEKPYLFFQGGWGKIAAAASTQYTIDRWKPRLLINLGTCGGFKGYIERGEILLIEKTIVYDIQEQMGDAQQAIQHYTTELDLSWLGEPYPLPVRRTPLVSGDRDLLPEEAPTLAARYAAVAGDWESAAIAWTAARNRTPVLILRGVSDLVSRAGSPAYGNLTLFEEAAEQILKELIASLPLWKITF